MQSEQTPKFFRKVRGFIKQAAIAVFVLMTFIYGATRFLLSGYGEPYLIAAAGYILQSQKSYNIAFNDIKARSGDQIHICDLSIKDKGGQLLARAPSITFKFSVLQLFHGSFPLEIIEIPNLYLDPAIKNQLSDSSQKKLNINVGPQVSFLGKKPLEINRETISFKLPIPFWILAGDVRLNIDELHAGALLEPFSSKLKVIAKVRWNPFVERVQIYASPKAYSKTKVAAEFVRRLDRVNLQLAADNLHLLALNSTFEALSAQNCKHSTFKASLQGSRRALAQIGPQKGQEFTVEGSVAGLIQTQEGSLELKSYFDIDKGHLLRISDIKLAGLGWQLAGEGEFDLIDQKADLSLDGEASLGDNLRPWIEAKPIEAHTQVKGIAGKYTLHTKFSCPQIKITELEESLDALELNLVFKTDKESFVRATIDGYHEGEKLKSEIYFKKQGPNFNFDHLSIESSGLNLALTLDEAAAVVGQETQNWHLSAQASSKRSLFSQYLLKKWGLHSGSTKLHASWQTNPTSPSTFGQQTNEHPVAVDFNLEMQQMQFGLWRVHQIDSTGRLKIELQEPNFLQNLDIENFSMIARDIEKNQKSMCDKLSLNGFGSGRGLYLQLGLERNSRFEGFDLPYKIESEGLALFDGNRFRIVLEDLRGRWADLALKINHSALFEVSKDKIACSDFKFDIGEGHFDLDILSQIDSFSLKSKLSKVPLELFSLVIGKPIFGQLSGELEFTRASENVVSRVDLELGSLRNEIFSQVSKDVQGKVRGSCQNSDFKLMATLQSLQKNLKVEATGRADTLLALGSSNWLDPESTHDLHLNIQGNIGLFSKLFTGAGFNFDGEANLALHTWGTYQTPLVAGDVEVKEASYDHYSIGLKLQNCHAKLRGQNSSIILDELVCQDPFGNSLKATGALDLDDSIRSRSSLELSNFCVINTPIAKSWATGKGFFEHKGSSAKFSGKYKLEKTLLNLPSTLPRSLPQYEGYTLIRTPGEQRLSPILAAGDLKEEEGSEGVTKAVAFDLCLKMESGSVNLKGRGLNTAWEGELTIKGYDVHPQLRGQMTLNSGDYSIANRRFALKEGQVVFNDRSIKDSSILATAETTVNQLAIKVRLDGTLGSPRVQFKSTPQLPLTDQFSYLLFGKAYNTLSPFQGLSVAQLVMETSGDPTSFSFNQLRKQAGIDRFDIESRPGVQTSNSEDIYTIKLGKYVTDGFLIGISKNVSAEGSQLTLEVDLSEHLSLITALGYLENSSLSLMWKKDY